MMDEYTPEQVQPWRLRTYKESDRNFIALTWLKGLQSSPLGRQMRVQNDPEALKRFWPAANRVVLRLVDTCDVTVAEAEVDGIPVIVGYMVHEADVVLHWITVRNRFTGLGIAKDLLADFMVAPGVVLYTFQPATRGLKPPPSWKFDPLRVFAKFQ
jgi:hypothetical protein